MSFFIILDNSLSQEFTAGAVDSVDSGSFVVASLKLIVVFLIVVFGVIVVHDDANEDDDKEDSDDLSFLKFTLESFNLVVLDGGDVLLRTVLQIVPTALDLVMTSEVCDATDPEGSGVKL